MKEGWVVIDSMSSMPTVDNQRVRDMPGQTIYFAPFSCYCLRVEPVRRLDGCLHFIRPEEDAMSNFLSSGVIKSEKTRTTCGQLMMPAMLRAHGWLGCGSGKYVAHTCWRRRLDVILISEALRYSENDVSKEPILSVYLSIASTNSTQDANFSSWQEQDTVGRISQEEVGSMSQALAGSSIRVWSSKATIPAEIT